MLNVLIIFLVGVAAGTCFGNKIKEKLLLVYDKIKVLIKM